jgi:pyruvate kinase
VLLADGAAELRVASTGDDVVTEVVRGGTVRSRAGVSVPSERLSAPPLTDKDRPTCRARSSSASTSSPSRSSRRGSDVQALRSLLGEAPVSIVAKIETDRRSTTSTRSSRPWTR